MRLPSDTSRFEGLAGRLLVCAACAKDLSSPDFWRKTLLTGPERTKADSLALPFRMV